MNTLLEENDELREKLEHDETHNNALIRNHSKIVSDLTTKISILESEKESLKQQTENYHKETANLNETLASHVRKMHDLERENTKMKLNNRFTLFWLYLYFLGKFYIYIYYNFLLVLKRFLFKLYYNVKSG